MLRCSIGWKFACCCLLILVGSTRPVNAQSRISLFNGRDLEGWMGAAGGQVGNGWRVEDGVIHLDPAAGSGGNIVTAEEYGDFELAFEWKISKGGNSGIKYRVKNFGGRILGCEYQVLDDAGASDGKSAKTSVASLYHMYEPGPTKYVRLNEFNSARVVVCGQHIQHWLNDELVVSAWVGSPDWHARKNASKFQNVEGFGENRLGRIMLTDHHSEVWYRNMTLRPLAGCDASPLLASTAAGQAGSACVPCFPRSRISCLLFRHRRR